MTLCKTLHFFFSPVYVSDNKMCNYHSSELHVYNFPQYCTEQLVTAIKMSNNTILPQVSYNIWYMTEYYILTETIYYLLNVLIIIMHNYQVLQDAVSWNQLILAKLQGNQRNVTYWDLTSYDIIFFK